MANKNLALQMDAERPFRFHASTIALLDGDISSQLILEKTFSRNKGQLKQAKDQKVHR